MYAHKNILDTISLILCHIFIFGPKFNQTDFPTMYYSLAQRQLDPLDRDILEALTRDARTPFSQLAQELRVSNSLIHQRVRKLKEAGILKDAAFRLDPDALGYESCAYTQIMLTNAKFLKSVVEALAHIPEVVECVNIAGRYAVMVKVYAVNNNHLREVVYEKIQPIEGVEGTNTVVVFETPFRRNVPLSREPASR
ncbi:MAG: winged helix-turn-helix transcriptional regulator [Bacteroidetes bacterium]|nr:MAG: winged helix-turn-helix transcriptional regulator [Bacteroidota bacterium]